ncbi:MAG: hypothetical protein PHU43_03935 [Candidatus Bipolaricaulis sp.]|nr:hypothetical protein [Candidatus Bipolaricaulis sp.]
MSRRVALVCIAIVFTFCSGAVAAPTGWILFESERSGGLDIFAVRPDGFSLRQLTANAGADSSPPVSPDGSTIAFTPTRDGDSELYLMNLDGSEPRRLTHTAADKSYPSWSPDGTKIVSSQHDSHDAEIGLVDVSTGETRKITDNDVDDWVPSWSPSGDRIAFARGAFPNNCICAMAPDGTGLVSLTACSGYRGAPEWSPDGAWIAYYQEVAAGNTEISIMVADVYVLGVASPLTEIVSVSPAPRGWDCPGAWIADDSAPTP